MIKHKAINMALMAWNPLNVVGPALSDEYIGLIPSILEQKNELDLESFLKEVMSDEYGLEFQDSDEDAKKAFRLMVKQLAAILW